MVKLLDNKIENVLKDTVILCSYSSQDRNTKVSIRSFCLSIRREGAGSPTDTLTSIETSASSQSILFSLKWHYLVKLIGCYPYIPSI